MRSYARTRSRALAIGLFAAIAAGSGGRAHADVIQTYDFTGTLAQSIVGLGTAVAGTFSLDLTDQSITAYSFTAPGDTVAMTGFGFGQVFEAAVTSPAADVVYLSFNGGSFSNLRLIFETTLAAFSDNPLYVGPITGPGFNGATAEYICEGPEFCSIGGTTISGFSSGEATLVSVSGVPEPASAALLGGPLLAQAMARRRRAE